MIGCRRSYSETRRKLASLLDRAVERGEVRIKRGDGQSFVIRPEAKQGSPLDVVGLALGITTDEILSFVQEETKTEYDFSPLTERNDG